MAKDLEMSLMKGSLSSTNNLNNQSVNTNTNTNNNNNRNTTGEERKNQNESSNVNNEILIPLIRETAKESI